MTYHAEKYRQAAAKVEAMMRHLGTDTLGSSTQVMNSDAVSSNGSLSDQDSALNFYNAPHAVPSQPLMLPLHMQQQQQPDGAGFYYPPQVREDV